MRIDEQPTYKLGIPCLLRFQSKSKRRLSAEKLHRLVNEPLLSINGRLSVTSPLSEASIYLERVAQSGLTLIMSYWTWAIGRGGSPELNGFYEKLVFRGRVFFSFAVGLWWDDE